MGAIRELCEQRAVYPFLSIESDGEYHNPIRSVGTVRTWYLSTIDEELNQAMGLVDQAATTSILETYLDHVVHYIRGEKRFNTITGQSEKADETLMAEVENKLGIDKENGPAYRESLVHRVAAWRMDNPEDELRLHRTLR